MPPGRPIVPLLDETIGANLERTVATYPDAEALVEVATGRRWTYAEFDAAVNQLARGLLAGGIVAGDRIGDVVAQLCRVGADPVRDGQGRRDLGQHQPGLPNP